MTHRERTEAAFAAHARKEGIELRGVTPELVDAITAALEAVERETEARTWERAATALDRWNAFPDATNGKDVRNAAIEFRWHAGQAQARAAGPQAQPGAAEMAGSESDRTPKAPIPPLPRGEAPETPPSIVTCVRCHRKRPWNEVACVCGAMNWVAEYAPPSETPATTIQPSGGAVGRAHGPSGPVPAVDANLGSDTSMAGAGGAPGKCPTCGGPGWLALGFEGVKRCPACASETPPGKCRACGGLGKVPNGDMPLGRVCPRCNGTGSPAPTEKP